MAQKLVSKGHSWSSVKEYTLAEIGSFLLVIAVNEKEEELSAVSQMWLASNLDPKNFKKMFKELERSAGILYEKAEYDQTHIDSEWRRLAAAASSFK